MPDIYIINLSVLIAFSVFASIQLFYYLVLYIRAVIHKSAENNNTIIPVTVVICARNEEENLQKNLEAVLEQDYPEYEVVVVNDCSEDDTEDVLKRFMQKYPHLRTTFIKLNEKFTHGKKLALTVGIKSAIYDHVVLTDADCCPSSPEWLKNMVKNFSEEKTIILGYGGYETKPGFLNLLIRFDTAIIALQYISYALFGKPYMGVGRNLAYNKSVFFNNKGFASHARLQSGDDDLFINEVANKKNVAVEINSAAHTRSEAKKRFSDWVEQKQRHYTTFARYKFSHKFLLGFENFSRVLFYFLFISLLILQEYWIAALAIFVVRLVVQLIIFGKAFKRLAERKLLLISPIFDFLMPFISLGIYISNKLSANKQWR